MQTADAASLLDLESSLFLAKNAKPFDVVHLHFGGFSTLFFHFLLIAEAAGAEYYLCTY